MNTLKNFLEEEEKKSHLQYYVYECEFCHEKILVNSSEIAVHTYAPVEKEVERGIYNKETKKFEWTPVKEMVSSDPSKDMISVRCCNCGHTQSMLKKDFQTGRCNRYGNNNLSIELNETETKEFNDFCDVHKDCCQKKLGKKFFSSTGGQFSLEITPTSLGNAVVVKCNACGATKDITDSTNW